MLVEIKRATVNDQDQIEGKLVAWRTDYEVPSAEVKYTKYGAYLVLNGESEGCFMRCDVCKAVFDVLPGNIYDDMAKCTDCGASC